MESDDEYEPTAEDMEAEEEEEPLMMSNAEAWDNFLDYIRLSQAPWAPPLEDTDLYRKQRAAEFFNAGARARPAWTLAARAQCSFAASQVARLRTISSSSSRR